MGLIKKVKKNDSSLEELKKLIDESNFSINLKNVKSIIYNNLVKNVVKNVDYIIIAGVTFYFVRFLSFLRIHPRMAIVFKTLILALSSSAPPRRQIEKK